MKYIIKQLAKLIRWRFKPRIVVVASDDIQSSAGEAICAVLKTYYRVKKIEGNKLNLYRLAFRGRNECPEIFVFERKADWPNSVRYFLEVIRPYVGVAITADKTPVHKLLESLNSNGFAVLNFDDEAAVKLKEKTRGRVVAFGFGDGADLKISNLESRPENDGTSTARFKIEYSGSVVPFAVRNFSGESQVYAVAAAICVGLIFDLNLVEISEALSKNNG